MNLDLHTPEIQQKQTKGVKQTKLSENTSYYIKTYLCPYGKWSITSSPKQRIDLLKSADVDWTSVSDHIKGMDYQDFLRTPYWKAIAAHTKFRAGYRCQLCNSRMGLITHHRDYSIHGQEHAHIYDLTVLCNNCHEKFHDTGKKKTRLYESNHQSTAIPAAASHRALQTSVLGSFHRILSRLSRRFWISFGMSIGTFQLLNMPEKNRKAPQNTRQSSNKSNPKLRLLSKSGPLIGETKDAEEGVSDNSDVEFVKNSTRDPNLINSYLTSCDPEEITDQSSFLVFGLILLAVVCFLIFE